MRKSILAFVFVLMACPLVRAEQSPDSLKDMAVAQIFEYGENLYDRGDYEEARHAFEKVLQLDPQYKAASDYLAQMGAQPSVVVTGRHSRTVVESVSREYTGNRGIVTAPMARSIVITPVAATAPDTVLPAIADVSLDDIRQQIAAEDSSIRQLNTSIARLHAGTETTSHE